MSQHNKIFEYIRKKRLNDVQAISYISKKLKVDIDTAWRIIEKHRGNIVPNREEIISELKKSVQTY